MNEGYILENKTYEPEREIIVQRTEGFFYTKLRELLRTATVGMHEESKRLFLNATFQSEEDFMNAALLLSLDGMQSWQNKEQRMLTIDNHFDIEALIEEGMIPLDLFSPQERDVLRASNDLDVEEALSSDDVIEKYPDEVGEQSTPISIHSFTQHKTKYRREPGGIVYRRLQNGGEEKISYEEEIDLFNKAKSGDVEARNEFIVMNLGLIHFVAQDWYRKFPKMQYDDIFQEATIGMMRSLDTYPIESGRSKFNSYAVASMRNIIVQLTKNTLNQVHIPYTKASHYSKIDKLEYKNVDEKMTKEEMVEKLSTMLNCSPEDAEILIDERELHWKPEYVDIDDVTDGEELESLSTGNEPEEAFEKTELRELTARAIDALSPRQAMMLRMRFGIDTDRPLTHAEIGKAFGVSREAVRLQIAHIIEKKLRLSHLKDYNTEK